MTLQKKPAETEKEDILFQITASLFNPFIRFYVLSRTRIRLLIIRHAGKSPDARHKNRLLTR